MIYNFLDVRQARLLDMTNKQLMHMYGSTAVRLESLGCIKVGLNTQYIALTTFRSARVDQSSCIDKGQRQDSRDGHEEQDCSSSH